MISRIKQGMTYIFARYREEWNREVRHILNKREFEIFEKMGRYDRIHSYNLLKSVESDELLKSENIYKKLALLHDCGKENIGLLRRVKKVLLNDKKLSAHAELGYLKIKDIDKNLAELIRDHHTEKRDKKMIRFQKLDDR